MKNYNGETRNLKILIAEDDFLVSEMIEGELINAGYEIIGKVSDGEAAIELTRNLKPDLVLMDIRMPKLNGIEASKKIMDLCPTPIIILSAYDDINMVIDAGDSGVTAFLNKPLDTNELERSILISMARFNDIMILREKNLKLQEAHILNESLMKEIHHRVKNNFQLVSSLLNLQMVRLDNKEIALILQEGIDRIQTLAILHEKLYETGNLVSLPMNLFLEDLLNALIEAYTTVEKTICLDTQFESIVLDSKKAVSIGLIINEAVTNSIKYAFKNIKDNTLTISISMVVEGKDIVLRIKDNGIGVSNIGKIKSEDTLGMQLIFLLTESQLEGSIDILSNEGLEIIIRFKP